MASYTGIHVEHSCHEEVANAIDTYEREHRRRKVRRLAPTTVDADAVAQGQAGPFSRIFLVGPAVEKWVEILTCANCWRLTEMSQFLSKELNCRCLVFGYQTTVGQTYYQMSERGECVRTLWYTQGEPIHEEAGERLEFEERVIEEQRVSLAPEDMELIEEWDEDSRETILLPDCERFAEGIGCKSFLNGLWHLNRSLSEGICVKSTARWWFFG